MSLKITTFNCRGLQDRFKRKKIFRFLHQRSDDIVLLQETHSLDENLQMWKLEWGGEIYANSATSNSRGVAVLFKPGLDASISHVFSDGNGRVIILDVLIRKFKLRIINVYAPNQDDPDFFLDLFSNFDDCDQANVILGGDLNLAMGPLDYQGSRVEHCNSRSRNIFSFLTDEYNLNDTWRLMHPTDRVFTRHQQNPIALSRLDYVFVSNSILANVLSSTISHGLASDHSTVTVEISTGVPKRGRGYWKLNCHLLQRDADFIKYIKIKIDDFKKDHANSSCNPHVIWDSFKSTIVGYCMEYSARKKKERMKDKCKLEAEIEVLRQRLSKTQNDAECNEIMQLLDDSEKKLEDIYDFETAGAIIRSRAKWAEEGEKSTKFFCNLEKRHTEKKNIYMLKNANGSLIVNPQNIMKELHGFYSSLYSSHWSEDSGKEADNFFEGLEIPKFSHDQKEKLNQRLTKAELFNAIKSMPANKCPGLDGLPKEFYVAFFNDIYDMLTDSYAFSFEKGFMSQSQRHGIISLLPKNNKDPLYAKNYRPISLLNVDYKIIAKCFALRLKSFLLDVIHDNQSGFLKGRNIAHNIRLIIDLIDYTNTHDVPGALLLLDIEKAFDSVEHEYLYKVLDRFDVGHDFLTWMKCFYNNRSSYVLNNGYLSPTINLERGIFQGCPISPYLFLLAIEILGISIRSNPLIKGVQIGEFEHKVSMYADDTTCFLNGDLVSINNLFDTLEKFGTFSGCKVNILKSEGIWLGSLKKSREKPFSEKGLVWGNSVFSCLGIKFSLDLDLLFELNYNQRLGNIEQTLNCWRSRSLSLIGKVTVVKTLVLPKLLFLFTTLCIHIPEKFFKKLEHSFFKFIWSGGNDRIKRKFLYNDYDQCGLKMVDIRSFALAQKLVWSRHILNDDFKSDWKQIEINSLIEFHADPFLLFRANAPGNILKKVNVQLVETIKVWYMFRSRLLVDLNLREMHKMDMLWFNKNICLKTKKYFYYSDWYDKGIKTVQDLMFDGNRFKEFFELVLEFDISIRDRRKYSFLIKAIPLFGTWSSDLRNPYDLVVSKLFSCKSLSKFSYSVFKDQLIPMDRSRKWNDIFGIDLNDEEWMLTHRNNLKCTIETQLRSFYVKSFHKAIATNDFLYKIKRSDTELCSLCSQLNDSIQHFMVECTVVNPLWKCVEKFLSSKLGTRLQLSTFQRLFGCNKDQKHYLCINFFLLCTRFYIYRCKFRKEKPNFQSALSFFKIKYKSEYLIALKNDRMRQHFQKFVFVI